MKVGDMRGYHMVTRTFRQPGANKPVDARRLTLSSAPFVVLAREVRWHAGLPYGYPHLSSTRGKRARWRKETNIVFCTFCHPGTASQVAGGDTLWSFAPFVNRGERIRWCQDDVGHLVLIIFKIFAGFTLVVRKHSSPMTREILLCWAGTIECNGVGKCRGCPTLSLSRHWSLLALMMPFLFFLNVRFRWWGYWPTEWCSARTKLVSYVYFVLPPIKDK